MLAPCIFGTPMYTVEIHRAWTKARAELGIINTRPEQISEHSDLICGAANAEGIS